MSSNFWRRMFLPFALLLMCPINLTSAGKPAIDDKFIVFGYAQSTTVLPLVRWNALTHIACLFTVFDGNGNFTNLSSTFTNRDSRLKAGGAAQAAGVKVIMCVNNFDDVSGGEIEQVMTNSTKRQTLITNIKNAVEGDAYCAGVNFDIEFSWGTSVRDGFALLLADLRSQLNASKEISVYVHSSYSSTLWNATALATNCDYILQSGYDYATGSTPHAITDHNNNFNALNSWFNAGIPPEKMIYTVSIYSRRWAGVTTYNQSGSTSDTSMGFTDGLYDTTLRVSNGGPFTSTYVTGDEAEWYTYNNGSDQTVTWDSEKTLEVKMRAALAFPGSGNYLGRRMKGVGFWSLFWMNEAGAKDPISGTVNTTTDYYRTYPQVYQLTEEIFAPPGTQSYVFEKFEDLNPHWDGFSGGAAATPSPDNSGVNVATTTRAIVTMPTPNAPPNSTNAMRLNFAFSSATGKLFFRHELMKSSLSAADQAVVDTNAVEAKFAKNNKVNSYLYVGGSGYANTTVRMVVMDSNRQLEASPAVALSTPGWQQISWDLTSTTAGNVTGLTTVEPAFVSGNGTLDVSSPGARDIAFIGFLINRNAGGAASGTLYFDELSYEPTTPGSAAYTVNEFRYNGVAGEFVEIHGPTGAIPTGTELRFYDSATGAVSQSISLAGQTIPASGLFVVGDTGVPNVNLVPAGWTAAANNIPESTPNAMQIYNTSTAAVYDSVVFEAMGGLSYLVRPDTNRVTREGQGWIGEVATGTDSSSVAYSMGRYPDGADTDVNEKDFSNMKASPGVANGGTVIANGTTFNFTTVPPAAFQTYQLPRVAAPPVASPGSGGNAQRTIDLTGGGTMGSLGDAALGAGGAGYSVSGYWYIPAAADPAQAVAIGFCGTQGSNFFSSTNVTGAGYESGYYIVYEQGAANLNDGLPAHTGAFQFMHSHRNNQSATPVDALGSSKTLAQVPGSAAGAWVPFTLSIQPGTNTLYAKLNNTVLYAGVIPSGGPTFGSFVTGYREFNSGTVTSAMGTWVDDVKFSPPLNANVENWALYGD